MKPLPHGIVPYTAEAAANASSSIDAESSAAEPTINSAPHDVLTVQSTNGKGIMTASVVPDTAGTGADEATASTALFAATDRQGSDFLPRIVMTPAVHVQGTDKLHPTPSPPQTAPINVFFPGATEEHQDTESSAPNTEVVDERTTPDVSVQATGGDKPPPRIAETTATTEASPSGTYICNFKNT